MPLRHHLRAEQHGAVGLGEAAERSGQQLRLRSRVGVEADQLELGEFTLELALELLRPGAETCKLRRAAGRAHLRRGLGVAAVVAAQRVVAV